MKYLVILLLLQCAATHGQVHWLVNKDSVPDCSLVRNGTFVAHGTTTDPATGTDIVLGYKLVFSGNRSTEYVGNDGNRIECNIEFDGPCTYRSTVTHVEHPYGVVKAGLVIMTEILETAAVDHLVMIRAKNEGDDEWQTFVIERID